MASKNLQLWAAVLLLVGGLVHLIPQLYSGLTRLTGGTAWVQVMVGILSVVVALVMFAGDKDEEELRSVDSQSSSPQSPSI
jgi:hypothetical protein